MKTFKASRIATLFFLAGFTATLAACNNNKPEGDDKAQAIIEKAIKAHGGDNYKQAHIHFDFRNKTYKTKLNEGKYRYERTYEDTSGFIKEVMTNDSAYRLVNGQKADLSGKEKAILEGSLNSVNYFILLPYHLNDEAVIPEYLGKVKVKDTPYHKIKVNFRKKGGGKDHQDTYMYWFETDDYTMDYLAYRYYTNDGGVRFRDATRVMKKGGIQFQNYLNMGPPNKDVPLAKVDSLFNENKLEKVSEINKTNIRVEEL